MSEYPCQICGKPVEVEDMPDDPDRGALLQNALVKLLTMVSCDECVDALVEKRQADQRRLDIRTALESSVGLGDLPHDIARFDIRQSAPDLEAKNLDTWAALRAYKRSDGCLWLWGPPGCGKSHAALSLLYKGAMRGLKVACVSSRRFTVTLQKFDDGRATIERWQYADLLCIDDLDKLHATENNLSGLWELLDVRTSRQLPTIVTSNLDRPKLRELWFEKCENDTLPAAVLDRLKPCLILEMQGVSLRGQVVRLSDLKQSAV